MTSSGRSQTSAASELAERMDAIGGQVNAYTTREGTCYYARVLDEHLDRAGDLLASLSPCPAASRMRTSRACRALFVAARAAGSDHAVRQLHPSLHAQAQGHRAKPDQHRLSRPADGGAEERFTMALLSSILGGNMSSRLFQTVREKNGLCYAIYTLHGELSRLRHVRHLRRRRP